jgi:hypothetical protein
VFKNYTISLPSDLRERSREFCNQRNLSFSSLVARGIEQVLAGAAPAAASHSKEHFTDLKRQVEDQRQQISAQHQQITQLMEMLRVERKGAEDAGAHDRPGGKRGKSAA